MRIIDLLSQKRPFRIRCKARWGLHTCARNCSRDENVTTSAFGTRSVFLEQCLDGSKFIGTFRKSKGIVRTLDGEGLALALERPRRQISAFTTVVAPWPYF